MKIIAASDTSANILRELIRERRSHSPYGESIALGKQSHASLRRVIIILENPIPGIEHNGNDWEVHDDLGVLWHRGKHTENAWSFLPESILARHTLVPVTETFGSADPICAYRRVFNLSPKEAPSCVPLLATQDINGDFWLEENEHWESTTTTGINTTTTSTTIHGSAVCYGTCKFIADVNLNWVQDSSTCGTTTTTTPGGTTTTTTPITCACPITYQTTTTTDTPSTTTTTTTPNCQCLPPLFCPTVEDQCTYTSCTESYVVNPLDCATTSTTTTTVGGTTSTTTTPNCNCSTTTTTPASCGSGGCVYWGRADHGWDRKTNTCPQECPCTAPSRASANFCDEIIQPCVMFGTTTTTIPCSGYCDWAYQAPAHGLPGGFVQDSTMKHCVGYFCVCGIPTVPLSVDCNVLVRVPCVLEIPTTTTTPNGDPCVLFCNTSTTGTTSTTTTPPCGTVCIYSANGSGWTELSNDCSAACECPIPSSSPLDTCQLLPVPCISTTTSTTTTSPPTTTTTTPNCTSGECDWECYDSGSGSYYWATYYTACILEDCECLQPTGPCTVTEVGNQENTGCGQTTTTTTTSTTTTPACHTFACTYICNYLDGIYSWLLLSDGCYVDCDCPTSPLIGSCSGANIYAIEADSCRNTTTTSAGP